MNKQDKKLREEVDEYLKTENIREIPDIKFPEKDVSDFNFKVEFSLEKLQVEAVEAIKTFLLLTKEIKQIQRDIRAIKKELKMK